MIGVVSNQANFLPTYERLPAFTQVISMKDSIMTKVPERRANKIGEDRK
jgi:hypothetical protein